MTGRPRAVALAAVVLFSCAGVFAVRVQQLQQLQQRGSAGFVYGSLQEYTEALGKSEDTEQRRLAARGIARLVHDHRISPNADLEAASYKAAMQMLWTAMDEDKDLTVRGTVFESLVTLGDMTPDAAAVVLEECPFGDLRAKAARVIGEATHAAPAARRSLVEGVADIEQEVRLSCFDALERQGWWTVDRLRYFLDGLTCPVLRGAVLFKFAELLRPMSAEARRREVLKLCLDAVEGDAAATDEIQGLLQEAPAPDTLPAPESMPLSPGVAAWLLRVLGGRVEALMAQAAGQRRPPERTPHLEEAPRPAVTPAEEAMVEDDDPDEVPDLIPEQEEPEDARQQAYDQSLAAYLLGKVLAYWDFLALMGVPEARVDTPFFTQALHAVEEVSISSRPVLTSLGGGAASTSSDGA